MPGAAENILISFSWFKKLKLEHEIKKKLAFFQSREITLGTRHDIKIKRLAYCGKKIFCKNLKTID